MAAPVIWFGSWFLSLMAGSRCASFRGFSLAVFSYKKKRHKGAHAHRPIWMALAIPGGAAGYDDDKELGNFITHMAAQTSRRLRKHSRQTLKVKARGNDALIWRLAGFR